MPQSATAEDILPQTVADLFWENPIAIQEFPIAVLTAVRVGGLSQDEQAVKIPRFDLDAALQLGTVLRFLSTLLLVWAICTPSTASSAPTKQPASSEVAILAGGCFWGMEDILRKIPGVLQIEVGYTGGWLENPRYDDTHDSKSGHAEAVRLVFDPRKLSYADLLEKWFFKMHDPTTLNRQGNDTGTQYRSAIFFTSEAQRKTAEEVKQCLDAAHTWKRPIVTEIVAASKWWKAEDYHQDYLLKHPGGYTCHYMRE